MTSRETSMRTHYVEELESVRENLTRMGDATILLLEQAISTVADPNTEPSERASELESRTDHYHRLIHDQCLNLITLLQAPVARDARLLTGVLDAIVDLELIADYAYEIVTLSISMKRRPPSQISNQMSEVGERIRAILTTAIESWREEDRDRALSVRPQEGGIRAACATLYERLSQLVSVPGEGAFYVDLMLICRHLERILRHAVCVADQVGGRRAFEPSGAMTQARGYKRERASIMEFFFANTFVALTQPCQGCSAGSGTPTLPRGRRPGVLLHRLPRLFLLLQRPEIVGDPVDVLICQDALPRRHIEWCGRPFGVFHGRDLPVLDDLYDFLLGVVV